MGLVFSPDGKTLAASSFCSWATWQLSSGKQVLNLNQVGARPYPGPWWLAFSPDSQCIGEQTSGPNVNISSAKTGALLQTFHPLGSFHSYSFSPDGKWLATGGQDKAGHAIVQLWDVQGISGT
jgi:WD40 repeat protein